MNDRRYDEFLTAKTHLGDDGGFDPVYQADFLFDFQQSLVEWAVRKGRGAIFADCGLGKTPMQLAWAENVARKSNGRVLIVTPLAVSHQTVREGEKFGVEVVRCSDGKPTSKISTTNYERLHLFDADDFAGVVCDESSILKSFDGKRRAEVTEFLRMRPYRLLCTATAAPNDYIELGTSSEALGNLGHMDMLTRYFKNDQNTIRPTLYRHRGVDFSRLEEGAKWRFKRHAETPFWRWVCSWARAMRRPSDLGFDDSNFVLPPLIERETVIGASRPLEGELFVRSAVGLREQREERRATLTERCEAVAEKLSDAESGIAWCHLNDEGDALERCIDGSIQVSGKDSDDEKEEKLLAFSRGDARVLVTKPKIASYGLNLQHCSRMTFFPSHSYEQYYQGVRRCWRFGQKSPVTVDVITTEGELGVLRNLQRKAEAADKMFAALVGFMNDALQLDSINPFVNAEELPNWL
jgi:hypothetical protein